MSFFSEPPSKGALWTGRILTALPVLLLAGGGLFQLTNISGVKQQMAPMGFPDSAIVPMLITSILCGLLYAFPPTTFLGALLITGYLGGAVVVHIRAADGMFWFPVLFGVIVWLGVFFRYPRLWKLIPLRS